MRMTSFFGLLLAVLLSAIPGAPGSPLEFTVSETAGLRRFGYPVTASLECARGAIRDAATARLLSTAGKELPAQFTVLTSWDDGSVRKLDVDFTSSVGPMESETYRVALSGGNPKIAGRGLAVTETADEIVVASKAISHRIRRDGKPLLTSIVNGKTEYLAAGGVATSVPPGRFEVLKRGPFNVTLRSGPVTLEYVSSKSWVKITEQATASTELAVEAQFALPESPVTWDLGVESWLYGQFPKPSDSAELRQQGDGWRVLTGDGKAYATGKRCEGWGHLSDKQRVVAFGVADFGAGGDPDIRFSADGHFRASAKRKELTVYFHVVGHPVQVTALTSPPSMLAPLVVKAGK